MDSKRFKIYADPFSRIIDLMIIQVMMRFSKIWMFDGDRLSLTDLDVAIMLSVLA